MINLNLQTFAKSNSYMQQYRKSKNILKTSAEMRSSGRQERQAEDKPRNTRGDAVSAVNPREEYELYRIEHGREVPVVRNGEQVVRTGQQVMDKMYYNKNREAWVSRDKGLKYRVRKRR